MLKFGTYRLTPSECEQMIPLALATGYRSFDTAALYQNEKALATALEKAVVEGLCRREEVSVTTKVHPYPRKRKATAEGSITNSLDCFGKVNNFLIHAPSDRTEELYQLLQGQSIGVSNFNKVHLQSLSFTPTVNQIEVSPFCPRPELLAYCKQVNLPVEVHSSLTKGERLGDARLVDIANQVGLSPAQLLLQWNLQQGRTPIITTRNLQHLQENRALISHPIRLEQEVIETLNSMCLHEAPFATHPQYLTLG